MRSRLSNTLLFGLGLLLLLAPSIVFGANPVADGLRDTAVTAELAPPGAKSSPEDVTRIAGNVIGSALSIIGVVFFILMVYGGFIWMTAHGKEQLVTKGKDTIIAAITGMIIIFSAYAITNLVFNSANTGNGAINSNPRGAECIDDNDCQRGFVCLSNGCQLPPEGPGVCERDQDCPANQVCRDRQCQANNDLMDLGLDDQNDGCVQDADCGAGAFCVAGACIQE